MGQIDIVTVVLSQVQLSSLQARMQTSGSDPNKVPRSADKELRVFQRDQDTWEM
jgi:hypothetical protein